MCLLQCFCTCGRNVSWWKDLSVFPSKEADKCAQYYHPVYKRERGPRKDIQIKRVKIPKENTMRKQSCGSKSAHGRKTLSLREIKDKIGQKEKEPSYPDLRQEDWIQEGQWCKSWGTVAAAATWGCYSFCCLRALGNYYMQQWAVKFQTERLGALLMVPMVRSFNKPFQEEQVINGL